MRVLHMIRFTTQREIVILMGETKIRINLGGDRLKTFANFGLTCSRCGVTATKLHVERREGSPSKGWHIQFRTDEGVMLTSDHIWPKSKGGGIDAINNRQPLCAECNSKKADEFPNDHELGELILRNLQLVKQYILRWRTKKREIRRIKEKKEYSWLYKLARQKDRKNGIVECTSTSRLVLSYGKNCLSDTRSE